MKIDSAQLAIATSHLSQSSLTQQETLRAWVGRERPNFTENTTNNSDRVSLSAAAQAAQAILNGSLGNLNTLPANTPDRQTGTAGNSAQAIEAAQAAVDNDPKLKLLRSILEWLFKRHTDSFDVSLASLVGESSGSGSSAGNGVSTTSTVSNGTAGNTSSGNPPQNAGYGIEYNATTTYSESEQTNYAAAGTIQTADGKTIQFQIGLAMSRSYSEQVSVDFRAGDAVRTRDPLVINFDGTAAQLSDTRFAFTLKKGENEVLLPSLTGNRGFLALDKNGNGQIDDGSELFGPATGNGFSELSAYDEDHNGWIDENDSVFQKLKVWFKDDQNNDQLISLKDKQVGAINLATADTPFEVRDAGNTPLGKVQKTGFFLQEDGSAGTIQQVDLTT